MYYLLMSSFFTYVQLITAEHMILAVHTMSQYRKIDSVIQDLGRRNEQQVLCKHINAPLRYASGEGETSMDSSVTDELTIRRCRVRDARQGLPRYRGFRKNLRSRCTVQEAYDNGNPTSSNLTS